MTNAPSLTPPPPPTWWTTTEERADPSLYREPPTRGAVAAVVLGAAGTDLAVWASGPGLAWTIGATGAAVAVVIGARPRRRAALLLLAAVPVLAVWCSVRTSPWLIVPDVIAINLCLILGADLAGRGQWFDQSLARVAARLVQFVEDTFGAVAWIRPAIRRSPAPGRRNWAPVLGGLAIGVPLVVVLGALLASADAVFASFVDVDLAASGSVAFRHVAAGLAGGLAVAAMLRKASATADPELSAPQRLSATVGNIVLAGVAGVFALYAASRVLALTGTAERIATTRGLTWADYARSGFFQLLAVAAITLFVLLTVCGWCDRGDAAQTRVRKVVGLLIVVEILGIVADAVHRLSGYEQAYGLTMLRWYSTGFALWLALVFGVVGVAIATDYRGRRWLTPTILTTALVALLVVNVANPERIVAGRNLTGPTRSGETDLGYLVEQLGDDALPVIDEHLDDLADDDLTTLRDALCPVDRPEPQWFNPNLARADGDRIVERWCGAGAS